MIRIHVFVKRLLCLECEEKHSRQDATFARDPKRSIYHPDALRCPRCGGRETLPEVGVAVQGPGDPDPEI